MSVNDKLTEQEFFENQVREYYSQLMKKLGIRSNKNDSFKKVYNSLASYVWEYSRENALSLFPIDTLKVRINNLFDKSHSFPILKYVGNDEDKLRFVQPSIQDGSIIKLQEYIKSINDFILIQKESNKESVNIQSVFRTTRFFKHSPVYFDGTILTASIVDLCKPDSKFDLKITIDPKNEEEYFNKPSVPLFYSVETNLEAPEKKDWVKTVGERYLVPDKHNPIETDYDSTKNIPCKNEGVSKSDLGKKSGDSKKIDELYENKSFFDC